MPNAEMQNYRLSCVLSSFFQAYESESMRRLAAHNFSLIMKLCTQVPEIARDISSEHINVIFKQLLSCNIKVSCLTIFC